MKRVPRLFFQQKYWLCTLSIIVAIQVGAGAVGAEPTTPPARTTPMKSHTTTVPAGSSGLRLDERPQGKALDAHEEGKRLYRERKDFEGALRKFQQALSLSENPDLLWNIALCEDKLKHFGAALTALEQYRARSEQTMTPKDRREAEALERQLRAQVTTLVILVSEPDAEVFVDDRRVGVTSTKGPIRLSVDPGPHIIRASKAGFLPFFDGMVTVKGEVVVAAKLIRERSNGKLVVEALPDSLVVLDGKVVGRTYYEGIVKPGTHSLQANASGRIIYSSELSIREGETRQVTLVGTSATPHLEAR